MRLWEIEMAGLGNEFADWRKFKGLRSADDYVKGKMFGKGAAKEGMLMADSSVILNPISKGGDDPALKKLAKDMSKGVVAFTMGKPNGEQLACEALQMAARSEQGRTELFCQLLKASTPSNKVFLLL